jgi:hypothetical protein
MQMLLARCIGNSVIEKLELTAEEFWMQQRLILDAAMAGTNLEYIH